MAIKLSKWNGSMGVLMPATGAVGGGAATGTTAATDVAGDDAGRVRIAAAGGAVNAATGGTAGRTSPEATGMTTSVEEEPVEATGGTGRPDITSPEVAGAGGGIGAENRQPTAVVPMN